MTDDMAHVAEWHFGDKAFSPFSAAEMARRLAALRAWMAMGGIDAALLTSPQSICYLSGWMPGPASQGACLAIDHESATALAPSSDGGRPWRQGAGTSLTFTDWRADNRSRAIRQLARGARLVGIEFDHASLQDRQRLEAALPGVGFSDIGPAVRLMRSIKSDEELALIRQAGQVADLGGQAARAAIRPGAAGYAAADAASRAMNDAIAALFPLVEMTGSRAALRIGPETDGPHHPPTNRTIRAGDILSLDVSPALFGYSAGLTRTLFAERVDAASRALWERIITLHSEARSLLVAGNRCGDIARRLNKTARDLGLPPHRPAGHGQSTGIVSLCCGREEGIDLREDVDTILEPGMVLAVRPMAVVAPGAPGAGGYCERDTVIVTAQRSETVTTLASGPGPNVIAPAA